MTVKTVTLEASSASGKKFYTIDLVKHQTIPGRPPDYTVEFRYGAVGGSVKTGTKTPAPVGLTKAENIFESLVKDKVNGSSHYVPVNGAATEYVRPALAATHAEPVKCLPSRLLNDVDPDRILTLTEDDDWWVQIKYDGDRVQLHVAGGNVTLFSGRSGKVRDCPKPIALAFAQSPHTMVLDGELVGDTLWVFDILTATYNLAAAPPEVHDFRVLPYETRHRHLTRIVEKLGCPNVWRASTHMRRRDKASIIIEAQDSCLEGVVFVNKNAPYEEGRPAKGGTSLRWKFRESASVIVASHNLRRSVDMKLADNSPIGTCTIPPNREIPPVGAVIEVEYLYCQTSLVQAVYKGVRLDVPREACTRSQLKFKEGKDPKNA